MRALRLTCVMALVVSSSTSAQSPDQLIPRLKDGDASNRRTSAEALGKKRVEAAIPALTELLKDPERSVREAARDALIRLGPKSIPALTAALKCRTKKAG